MVNQNNEHQISEIYEIKWDDYRGGLCLHKENLYFPLGTLFLSGNLPEQAISLHYEMGDSNPAFKIRIFPEKNGQAFCFHIIFDEGEAILSSLDLECKAEIYGVALTNRSFQDQYLDNCSEYIAFKGVFRTSIKENCLHSPMESNYFSISKDDAIVTMWQQEYAYHLGTQTKTSYHTQEKTPFNLGNEEWNDCYDSNFVDEFDDVLLETMSCDASQEEISPVPDIPPPPITLDVSLPQNKKAQSIHDIVKASFLQLDIKVIGTQFFMKYQMEEGYYKEQSTVLPDVMGALGDNREQLNSGDFKNLEHVLLHYPEVQIESDQFNSEPYLINTRAGILNWETKEIFPHSPQSYFTYSVDASYLDNPPEELQTPTFDLFCKTSLDGDIEKQQFLLEIIGYCLSDCTGAKCAFFFNGAPDSGKSVMLDFIGKLLAETVISSVPLHELHDKFKRAELMGKKLNNSGEIAGKLLKDISIYKSMTGNDRISAEHKGKSPFSYRCSAKLVFAGNTLPQISDTDVTKAFSNRMAILLFNQSIPKEEQDKNLLDHLLAERDAIFTKAIHALVCLERRNFVFQLPKESVIFRDNFLGMSGSVDQFVEERCDLGKDNKVHKDALYEAYLVFCQETEFTAEPKNMLIAHLLKFESIEEKRLRHNGENKQGLLGIALKPQNQTEESTWQSQNEPSATN